MFINIFKFSKKKEKKTLCNQYFIQKKKKYIRKLLNVELILLTLEKIYIYIYSHFIFFFGKSS